jgi:hypothetical protein
VESWQGQAAGATSVVGKAVLTLCPPLRPLSHNVNPRDGAQDISLPLALPPLLLVELLRTHERGFRALRTEAIFLKPPCLDCNAQYAAAAAAAAAACAAAAAGESRCVSLTRKWCGVAFPSCRQQAASLPRVRRPRRRGRGRFTRHRADPGTENNGSRMFVV